MSFYGKWGSDWELCARTNGVPFIPLVVKLIGDNTTGYAFSFPTPVSLPVFLSSFPITPEDGNFPWGINVFGN